MWVRDGVKLMEQIHECEMENEWTLNLEVCPEPQCNSLGYNASHTNKLIACRLVRKPAMYKSKCGYRSPFD